jgi:hypothetical protein
MTGSDGKTLPAGAHDFDFFFGSWKVRHRRLRERLVGSEEWDEFGGTVRVRPILAGLGNFDENVIGLPQGPYEACTLRIYHAVSQDWSIHWIDGRNPKFDTPMVGRFRDGVGTFLAEDVLQGRPIRVRFLWTHEGTQSARWEQAFSPDQGFTWETNWVMDFARV